MRSHHPLLSRIVDFGTTEVPSLLPDRFKVQVAKWASKVVEDIVFRHLVCEIVRLSSFEDAVRIVLIYTQQ